MKYKIYKFNFKSAHFGNGILASSEPTFTADRLYSALFLEAMKLHREKEFLELTKENKFRMSDSFPYMGEPYLPLPLEIPLGILEQSNLKKKYQDQELLKQVEYLPISLWKKFWSGDLTVDELINYQSDLFTTETCVKKGKDPFNIGVNYYGKTTLYIIATESELLDTLLISLQYSGLGGKRSSGHGAFKLEKMDLPAFFKNKLKFSGRKSLLLTTSLPRDEELDEALVDSKYSLVRRSGYVYSESAKKMLRKKILYKLKAGSVFSYTYQGGIYDIRPQYFEHPVWSYSKALFYQI